MNEVVATKIPPREKSSPEVKAAPVVPQEVQVKEAVRVEPKKDERTYEQQVFDSIDPKKTYVFELCRKSRTFNNHIIGNTSTIIDKVTGLRVGIRYIQGQDSLYERNQPNYEKEGIARPDFQMNFSRTRLMIPGNDTLKVAFMLMHDDYKGNPNRISVKEPLFSLVDESATILSKAALLDLKDEAFMAVRNATDQEIQVLGFLRNLKGSTLAETRILVREIADKDPQYIMNHIGNPLNTMKYLVKRGFDNNIIKVDTNSGQLVWCATGVKVTSVPADKDPLTYVSTIMATEEFRAFRDTLINAVDKLV